MTRAKIALAANAVAKGARKPGAPILAADSSFATLIGWLTWNDPNGIWGFPDEVAEFDPSVKDLWLTVEEMVN